MGRGAAHEVFDLNRGKTYLFRYNILCRGSLFVGSHFPLTFLIKNTFFGHFLAAGEAGGEHELGRDLVYLL